MDDIRVYRCDCGREFTNKQSYAAHCSHCEVKRGRKDIGRGSNIGDYIKSHPEFAEEICAKAGRVLWDNIRSGITPHPTKGKKKSDKSRRKQSETRKEKYLSGELTPAKGVGRGKGSYFRDIFLRSTYEAIFVIYLELMGISYSYETKRLQDESGSTHISDFFSNDLNRVFEVKGVVNDDEIILEKNLYESSEYDEYVLVDPDTINKIKDLLLSEGVEINDLIHNIYMKRSNKDYLHWDFINGEIIYKNL